MTVLPISKASEFSPFKRNGAFRSPVHARSVSAELPDVRHEGIRVRDRAMRPTFDNRDLHHRRFPPCASASEAFR